MRNFKSLFAGLLLFFVAVVSLVYVAGHFARIYTDYLTESRVTQYLPDETELSQQEKDVANAVSPAVVFIYGKKEVSAYEPQTQSVRVPGLNIALDLPAGLEAKQTQEVNAGTGFFVDSDGYILTNRHVVPDDEASYTVVLSDGRRMDAQVVYRDPNHDIAVIKIPGNGYPTLPLADSSELKIGQTVLTMGNAYGREQNVVSSGNITDLRKNIIAEDDFNRQSLTGLIQTSAQLFPGDSGGPTFDMEGKVVGVNVAVSTGDSHVSFSVPINDAKDAIDKAVPDE